MMDAEPAKVVSMGSKKSREEPLETHARKHLSSNRKRRSQAALYVREGWCAEWLVPRVGFWIAAYQLDSCWHVFLLLCTLNVSSV